MGNDETSVGLNPPKFISSSSAGTFEQCPQKWRFRYIDKLPDPPGRAALLGTYIHAVLERLYQQPSQQRTTDKAKEIAREIWGSASEDPDYLALELNDEEEKEFRWDIRRGFDGVWAIEQYHPEKVKVESTERNVQVQIGNVPFKGIIDLVHREDGELVVSDFKSGKKPRSHQEEKKKMKQVLLYAAALKEIDKETPKKVRLVFIGDQTNLHYEQTVTDSELEEPIRELHETWKELSTACANDEFQTRTSALCEWCPYIAKCSNGQEKVLERFRAGRIREDAPAMTLMNLSGTQVNH
tara:strand:- start:831 stop:1721 length:891 start_codon:yes stop_codon:yes gene_type:complete